MAKELNLWDEVEKTTTPQAEETAKTETKTTKTAKAKAEPKQDAYVVQVIGNIPQLGEWLKKHLDARAEQDELFAKTYAKPNKSIDECVRYIMREMEMIAKKNRQGNCGFVGGEDADLINIAIHYYDEDSIKAEEKKSTTTKTATPTKTTKTATQTATTTTQTATKAEDDKPKFVQLSLF